MADFLGVIVQCVFYLTIIDAVSNITWSRKTVFAKIICVSFNILIWKSILNTEETWSILGIILDTLGYCFYLYILKRQSILTIFAIVMETEIINQIGAVFVTLIIFALDNITNNDSYQVVYLYLGYILRILLLCGLYIVERKYCILRLLIETKLYYIIIIGMLFQFTRLVFRTYYNNTGNMFLYMAFAIFITGVIFSILWVIDWYYNEREKKLLWEDNHRMSQRLHKSKEIIPALSVVLEELKSNKDSGEFNDILDEIHQLCKEQIDENEKLSIQNKTFPTTEIRVLDEQIQLYETEAIEKDINFDVFVGTPMRQVLREKRIKELDFLRIIGDLMRNAFRAIERTGGEGGNILLVMGCVGEVLQIDIYDSGAPFPMFVLNEFGKRGNTEGGTGNGLSDTLELLEKYQATFLLTEYEDGAAYTKGISIIWDDKNERRLDSHRISLLSKDSPLFPKES